MTIAARAHTTCRRSVDICARLPYRALCKTILFIPDLQATPRTAKQQPDNYAHARLQLQAQDYVLDALPQARIPIACACKHSLQGGRRGNRRAFQPPFSHNYKRRVPHDPSPGPWGSAAPWPRSESPAAWWASPQSRRRSVLAPAGRNSRRQMALRKTRGIKSSRIKGMPGVHQQRAHRTSGEEH